MRLSTVPILAAAMLFFVSSSASAWRVDVSSNYDGVSSLAVDDTVTVTVWFDSEGATDLMLLGVGLEFDSGVLAYEQGTSYSPSYLMYTSAKAAYLQPLGECLTVGACRIHPGSSGTVVALDYASSKLATLGSIPVATSATNGTGPEPRPSTPPGIPANAESIGRYVFRVASLGDGVGNVGLRLDPQVGGIIQLGDGSNPTLTLGSPIAVTVPEPAAAVLSMAALMTLAGVRMRRRGAR